MIPTPLRSATSALLPLLCAGLLLPLSAELQFRHADRLNERDREVLTAFIAHADAAVEKLTPESVAATAAKAPETFAWVDFRNLECLNLAYAFTGDTAWLEKMRTAFARYEALLRTDADKYLGWYGEAIPPRKAFMKGETIDELQANFRAVALLSEWILLARENPEYAESREQTITRWIELMTTHLVPKWDARGFFVPIPGRGGVYRGLDFPSTHQVTLSHEKTAIAVDALLKLHRVTGDEQYLRRALELGAWFKSCLSLEGEHYEWMSWSPAGEWDISPDKPDGWKTGWIAPDPNAAWYVSALSIALNFYQHGLLFDDGDLARFLRTQKEKCWDGNLETPGYRNVAGVKNEHVKGDFLSPQLAHYDETLRQLAFAGVHEQQTYDNRDHPWKGGIAAMGTLKEKYAMAPQIAADPRPFRAWGERFLEKAENREFYEALNQPVRGPHQVPATPSAWRAGP